VGHGAEENLITLCWECHPHVHSKRCSVSFWKKIACSYNRNIPACHFVSEHLSGVDPSAGHVALALESGMSIAATCPNWKHSLSHAMVILFRPVSGVAPGQKKSLNRGSLLRLWVFGLGNLCRLEACGGGICTLPLTLV
jgi:hypothetical protein